MELFLYGKSNCLFHRYGGFHPHIADHEMYHRISVLVPVLVRVPEYLSTSASTSMSTITLEVRVQYEYQKVSTQVLRVRVPQPWCTYSIEAIFCLDYYIQQKLCREFCLLLLRSLTFFKNSRFGCFLHSRMPRNLTWSRRPFEKNAHRPSSSFDSSPLDKIAAAISQTTFSNAFLWMKFLFFYSYFTEVCS